LACFSATHAVNASDLLGLRFDLRLLRQDQGDQVIVRESEEGCAVHASP
jgi:hypothetical protein